MFHSVAYSACAGRLPPGPKGPGFRSFFMITDFSPGRGTAELTPDEARLAEARQLLDLLEQGAVFTTPKRSLLRYAGSKTRQWTLRQPYLSTLDAVAQQYLQLDYSEEALSENDWAEVRRMAALNALRCGRIVAIIVLDDAWYSPYVLPLLSRYFAARLKPDTLRKLVGLIHEVCNLTDFIVSIRLMAVTQRLTNPARMEEQPEKIQA